ncbi:hypothetical protein BLOT_012931 [Blomia tropicalis]|nr:hypothetical protein BLOT_012931 [Blomia tropicalis]
MSIASTPVVFLNSRVSRINSCATVPLIPAYNILIAISDEWRSPPTPINLMYAQLIGKIAADPHGAADTVPNDFGTLMTSSATIGCDGRNSDTIYM